MCGICGIVMRDASEVDRDLLNRMTQTLTHRGPDDWGIETHGPVGVGFRRLAILDLSPTGHQPMISADRNACVVFNGEIYNYQELRKEHETAGHHFRGQSDTEVLLASYAAYGPQMLPRFNGMFALAIHDRRRGKLVLARDRLGKKPLFLWSGPDCFAFASELRALQLLPGFPRELDAEALALFTRLGWVPDTHCVFRGVRKHPPASWIEFDIAHWSESGPYTYWDLPPPQEDRSLTESDWVDSVEDLLADAVRIRLRSDVPVGVFLSGGIDSGLVAALAGRSRSDLATVTVGFEEVSTDETALAEATARHLGLRTSVRRLSLPMARALLPSVIGHFDEPFGDASALPTALVCQEARRNFAVILSGDGGDEVFAGYPSHVRAHQTRHLYRIPTAIRSILARRISRLGATDSRWRRFWKRLGYESGRFGLGSTVYPAADWQEVWIDPEYRISPASLPSLLASSAELAGSSAVDAAQRFDLRFYLLSDILVKVDRMSMLHSLEVRSPFLDYRLVELGLRIPSRLRVKGGATKNVLRRLASRLLPPAVAVAPKMGFGIPLREWLFSSDATDHLRETLLSPDPRFPNLLRPGGAEALWKAAENNPQALGSAVFTMLAYRLWCAGQP